MTQKFLLAAIFITSIFIIVPGCGGSGSEAVLEKPARKTAADLEAESERNKPTAEYAAQRPGA
ncbi:hypothetical protein Pla22_03880 [Rubripirellula amarantea]|uniref:Uncharacterized protein n=1 Tax=Rubripirellula amarantea TaxID=2527999 RepID=A0A5C5WSJ1_9BACT|nr:hypothetical protein [Rubripirellula amarantea]TWT52762.1 hypothetical protein Pla22_03880 [Rubripirellula amarantea]